MKILITGATGFAGSALARRLSESGHDVRVLVRNKYKISEENAKSWEIIEGDLLNDKAVNKAVKGAKIVFHIAATFREPELKDQVYWEVNVKGTENILQAALKNHVERVVHCSTVGVHGHIEDSCADENYRFAPGDIYQITKLEGEKKALQFYKDTGLPLTIIRPAPIYGPGDLRLLKLFKLASKKITPILGNGNVFFNMVYIDDLVDVFILASSQKEAIGEVFIAAGPENLTLNEIIENIAEIVGKNPKKIYLPAAPFQLLGDISEKIFIPLGIKPPIYRRRVDFFTKSRSFDITKAKKMLGYHPKISVYEGIKRTAEWYRQEGYL